MGDWIFQYSIDTSIGASTDEATRGPFWGAPANHYSLFEGSLNTTEGRFDAMWSLGQPGYVLWDATNKAWISRVWDGDTGQDYGDWWRDKLVDYLGNETLRTTNTNCASFQVICGAWHPNGTDVYASLMWWRDANTLKTEVLTSIGTIVLLRQDYTDTVWSFGTGDACESGSVFTINIYIVCLELEFNPIEQTMHGCVFDRISLKYYYIVYDYINNKMYSQALDNTYYQMKSFTYNPADEKIYFAYCDVRFHKVGATIMRATFDSSRPEGQWIRFESVDVPEPTEWDIPIMISTGEYIMGSTGPNKGYIFQIHDEFYPRVSYADLTGLNGRELFEHLCSPIPMRMRVHEDNTLKIRKLEL